MQVSESYDLIVIGNQLSGYFLAAGAARAGKRVLLIEARPRHSSIFAEESGQFLTDLHWEPIVGLAADSAEDKFLRDMELYTELDEMFRPLQPPLQLISDGGRIDFSYHLDRMFNEWSREFPDTAPRLQKLGEFIQTTRPSTDRNFADLVARAGLESKWSQIGDLQPPLYGSVSPEKLSAGLMRQFFERAEKGGVRFALGGRDAVKEVLVSRLQWYGGKIKSDAWVEEIIFERKRLAGVLLSSFEGFVRSPLVVGNMNARSFLRLLPKEIRPEVLQHQVRDLKPRFWRLNFTLRLPASAVPEGMGEHVCFHESDTGLDEGQLLQLFVLPQDAYAGADDGEKTVLVRSMLPLTRRGISADYISVTIKRCIRRLETFMPFVREELLEVTPNPDAIAEDPVFRDYLRFADVEAVPHDMVVYGSTADPLCTTGLAGNWAKYGLPGLALCSRDVNPALGLVGEVQAAMDLLQEAVLVQ